MTTQWANKEALFKVTVPRERHSIPDVGDVWIYGLTCKEKDDYENEVIKVTRGSREVRMQNARAIMLIMTVRDQHGNRMFSDKDLGKISTMPASIVDPIYDHARKLSAMGQADLEELVKNSEKIQSAGSDTE